MKIIATKKDSYLIELSFIELGKITGDKRNIDPMTFAENTEIEITTYLDKAKVLSDNQYKISELKEKIQNAMDELNKIK